MLEELMADGYKEMKRSPEQRGTKRMVAMDLRTGTAVMAMVD